MRKTKNYRKYNGLTLHGRPPAFRLRDPELPTGCLGEVVLQRLSGWKALRMVSRYSVISTETKVTAVVKLR